MTSWYGGINSYFGSLVWQILSTNNTSYIILMDVVYNKVQKLDIFGSSLCSQK